MKYRFTSEDFCEVQIVSGFELPPKSCEQIARVANAKLQQWENESATLYINYEFDIFSPDKLEPEYSTTHEATLWRPRKIVEE